MPVIDGISVAQYIRKYDIDVDIIFITVSNQYIFQGYQYRAFAYCMKSVAASQLANSLIRYMEEKKNRSHCINIFVNGRNVQIPLNRVVFFESQKRQIIAHVIGEDIIFYGKMSELEEALPVDKFFRCHQSYIVNRDRIDSVRRTEVIVSGIPVPMSRKYYEAMSKSEEKNTHSMTITKSLALNYEQNGVIIFISGKLAGTIVRLNDGEKVTLGRDIGRAQIVIASDTVSRVHCTITYYKDENVYVIFDISKNGVFMGRGQKIAHQTEIRLSSGEELWIGDETNRIQLG
ncbi:MAG: FHA domain-containing protein [Lachnospiraceae bacterium]|nr:FHA domain-containing protein [Lachnospiraceae bacterium]